MRRSADSSFYAPLRWKEPRLVFTCSMSDFFHRQADPWREEAWDIMRRTPHLTYQVLTKRPGLAVAWYKQHGWLPNVWLGTSVETAKYLPRLDVLERVPAPLLFVSCEPLLSNLDLRPWLHGNCEAWGGSNDGRVLDWVIVGGESGPNRRPMETAWAYSIRDQSQRAGVPLFIKQGSSLWPGKQGHLPDDLWLLKEMPNDKYRPHGSSAGGKV